MYYNPSQLLHTKESTHLVKMVAAFDPLSPAQASSSSSSNPTYGEDKTTFRTLTRERQFRHPPSTASDVPALDELVAPHLESFNALVEDSESEGGKGLLQLGVEDIGEKVVFDGKGSETMPFGNRISCEFFASLVEAT